MREIEAVIEQIQSVLAWEHDPDQEYMETLVADYSRNVNAVNERLRQCESLLSRGLRTEAIQQCETEPNLLDLTAILDFPEVEFWSDYVSQYELPPLPELMISAAADLNDAYASEQPVAGLLKLHRLHALALSPLPVRIQVLNQLAAKDPSNPLWQEDLERYEDARLSQIEDELDKVLSAKNTRQAAALERELTGRKWSISIPSDVIRKAQMTRARLQTYDARKEMRRIAESLNVAYTESELDVARDLTTRWDSLLPVAAMPDNDPVFDTAERTLEWVRAEDEKESHETAWQNSLAALGRAIDREVGLKELERSAEMVSQFERDLPEELEERLQERVAAIHSAVKRRKLLTVLSAVSAVLVVTVLVLSFLSSRRHQEQVETHRSALQQLVETGRMEDAQSYFSRLAAESPSVAGSEELADLRNQLDAAGMEEQRRASEFAVLIQSTQDAISGDPDRSAVSGALSILNKAEALAVGGSELAQVDEARRAVEDVQKNVQKKVDDAFVAELAEAQKQFLRRPDANMTVNQTLTDLFVDLKRRQNITAELKQPIDAVISTLDKERAAFQRGMKISADLDRITAAVGNTERFRSQLMEYTRRHGSSERASAFQQLLSTEAALWDGPQLWNQFRDAWESPNFSQLSRATATSLLEQYTAFMESSQQFPVASELQSDIAALKAVVARRDDNDTPLTDRLRSPLEVYLQLPLVVAHGEDRYYTDSKELPEDNGDVVTVVPFRNDQLGRDTVKRVPTSEITNPRQDGQFVWDAPHAAFATSALERLDRAQDQWEETFGQLVTELAESEGIDPIVKMKLLYDLLKTGSEGSAFFSGAFAPHFAAIDQFTAFDANWILPSGSGAPSGRINARRILDTLPPFQEAAAAVAARDMASNRELGPTYRWAGWIHRRPDRVWICTGTDLTAADSGALVVIIGPASGQPASFAQIGSVAAGEVQVNNGTPARGFIEGRPVWLKVDGS